MSEGKQYDGPVYRFVDQTVGKPLHAPRPLCSAQCSAQGRTKRRIFYDKAQGVLESQYEGLGQTRGLGLEVVDSLEILLSRLRMRANRHRFKRARPSASTSSIETS